MPEPGYAMPRWFCVWENVKCERYPTNWGLPRATVVERQCAARGADACVIDISWKNPTLGWRFWTPTLRSNFSYSYASQDYQEYVLQFTPGSPSATSLNDNIQQVFANLIWSPFAETRNGVFGSGWLDIGLEYLWTRRTVFGGDTMTLPAGQDVGVANRILFATIARF